MQTFVAGKAVAIEVPLQDEGGNQFVPTAIEYRVLDAAGNEKVAPTPVTDITSETTSVTIEVSAEVNTLADDSVRELRVIELTITTAEGTVIVTAPYVIEDKSPLRVGINSFQTIFEADLLASELTNLTAWHGAARAEQVAAMIEAWRTIARMRFKYAPLDPMAFVEPAFVEYEMFEITPERFAQFPERFKRALREAQLLEADDLLGGNEYRKLREAGLMSKTVGESSQMYRPGRPVDYPICERAMRVLSPFVDRNLRLGRA